MGERKVERRLAAILAADVAGYSRLVGQDEEGTLERLKVLRRTVADPKIKEHRGRVVRTMGDGLLIEFASVVDAVRCAVDVQREMAQCNADLPADRRIEQVKNIARPVRVFDVDIAGETMALTPDPAARAPLALPDKPSIAVPPFQNMSGDPEQEYFADGMVEEIITALSRIRWLFVIARNSSFTYKGRSVGVKQVGRELGVRYVLEGSVRKGGNRVRITAQLIDAETGAHLWADLWADRFDGSLEDVFEFQDRVAINVAGVIEPALQAAEVRRSAARPMHDVTAYDLYLRALATYYPITKERLLEALELLHRAIAIDRHCGPASSLAAMCQMRLFREGWAEEPETAGEAVDLARQALEVAGDDPGILANAAFVLANFGEDIGAMMALVDRALTLTPSFSRGWFLSGVLRLWAGQHDLAIDHAETALRLSPRERTGTPLSLIGEAHFFKREFDEAASKLLLSIQEYPGYPHSYRVLAACYVHVGRLDEARAIIARLHRLRLAWCPVPHSCGALPTASCSYKAFARRCAKQN